MYKYLLDTNIISDLMRPNPNPTILKNFKIFDGHLAICSIVWHELFFGVNKMPLGQKRDYFYNFLTEVVKNTLPILNYDANTAEIHVQKRIELSKKGFVLPFADGQIASIAIANNLILVTRNTKDFSSIVHLQVENWFS